MRSNLRTLAVALALITLGYAAPWSLAAAEPTIAPRAAPEDDRVTILLLGGDAGPERWGLRTDTLIVATVERATGRAALFGVPRNLVNVPLPPQFAPIFACGCWGSLINELYPYAEANPDLFGGGRSPGAQVLKATIGHLLGLQIDYVALVDLPGFVAVIDALGGVTIDVPARIQIYISPAKEGEGWQQYVIEPGRQHLDGRTALAYVRSRENESDYDRMARQRCVLGALAREADVPSLLRSYPTLVKRLKNSVVTDVPREDLPDLIKLIDRIDTNRVVTLGFTTPGYMIEYVDPGYPVPDVAIIRHTVQDVLTQPLEAVEQTYGTLPTACGWPDS